MTVRLTDYDRKASKRYEQGHTEVKRQRPQRKESKPEKKPPLFVVKEKHMHSMNEEYIWFI